MTVFNNLTLGLITHQKPVHQFRRNLLGEFKPLFEKGGYDINLPGGQFYKGMYQGTSPFEEVHAGTGINVEYIIRLMP
jgi:hypothetical protein